MIRAWFVNEIGHKFSKEFDSGNKLEEYTIRAKKLGTRLIGFASI